MCGRTGHATQDCAHPSVSPLPSKLVSATPITLQENPVKLSDQIGHSKLTPVLPLDLFALSSTHSLKMLFGGMISEQILQGGEGRRRERPQAGQELEELETLPPVPCPILVDSGAGANFISLSVLESLGLIPDNGPALTVGLVDARQSRTVGKITLRVFISSYAEDVEFYVLKSINSAFQAILGNSWCTAHKTDLLFSRDGCELNYEGSRLFLPCMVPTPEQNIPCVPCTIISTRQARKELKTAKFFTVIYVTAPDAETPTDPELTALLDEFQDVFKSELPGLPPERTTFHTIPLKPGAEPPSRRMHRLSKLEHEETIRQTRLLLQKGLIEPSHSPYGAPILFVSKPDGTLRMCVDFRKLNELTIRNKYPLPRIDDLLDNLVNQKYFSSLDLVQAYYQVRLKPEDVPKTAFCTPDGLYQFKVLCFGLTNAPATFQAVINEVFGDKIGKILLAYLDDILVFSKTREEHFAALRYVLTKLREHTLFANLQKCHFFKESVTFLGHSISAEGLRPSPQKLQVVLDWAPPKNINQLQSFLGLLNYFRKFILGYAILTKPLTDLLKHDTLFNWTPECQAAFELCKQKLTSAPVLALPDNTKPFELVCDACKTGLGAVLIQDRHPICFEGRKLTAAEQNLDGGEQELLAVIYALHKFRCYLEGTTFTLVTDHLPNTYFKTQVHLSPKKVRWLDFLSRFHFEWQYRPGRINVADPLSRAQHLPALSPTDPNLLPLTLISIHDLSVWETGYAQDPWFTHSAHTAKLTKKEGRYVNSRNQIVVPNVPELKNIILKECHDAPYAGHQGVARTTQKITAHYWWTGLTNDVKNYIAACPSCQTVKGRHGKTPGLIQPLQIPKYRWQIVTMDFVTALPVTPRGYSAILVVVDKLTKMVRIIPCTENVGSKETAELFLRYVFKDHGMPLQFITDRGTQFTSSFFKELCRLLGTNQNFSTADHPETDGQTERMNRVVEEVLRHYVTYELTDWDLYIHFCEFAINNSYNESTKSTPFYLNYGRNPRLPLTPTNLEDPDDLFSPVTTLQPEMTLADYVQMKLQTPLLSADMLLTTVCLQVASTVPAAQELAQQLHFRVQRAKSALQTARSRMRTFANRTRQAVKFNPQEFVLLNCKRLHFPERDTNKLKPKWIGPFQIIQTVGKSAYKLKLPPTMKIHNVFHVNLLKKWVADPNRPVHPKPIVINGNEEFEVNKILGHRPKSCKGPPYHGLQYLVQYTGYGPEHNQFIPASDIPANRALARAYWKRVNSPSQKGSGDAAPYHKRPAHSLGGPHSKRGRGRRGGNT
jgi:RNase H-like domain found in reverse transcriptase/Reverse transcriptase (RNA-dependent DNA polymerase)/Integrase zinc binding domain/Integrase core domain